MTTITIKSGMEVRKMKNGNLMFPCKEGNITTNLTPQDIMSGFAGSLSYDETKPSYTNENGNFYRGNVLMGVNDMALKIRGIKQEE